MRIHPAIWISIGLLVVAISWWIGETLWLFSYLGLFFVAWGVIRIIVGYVTQEAPEKPVHPPQQTYPYTAAQQAAPQVARAVCPGCRGPLHAQYAFCPRCGTKTR